MDSDSGTRDHASPHVPMSLFEEIVKRPACAAGSRRVAGAARRWRGGLTFDRRARDEQRAGVVLVFRRDARRQRRVLRALPARARVERHALHAAVEIHAAARAAAVVGDLQRQQVAAPRAAEHLARRHQVRGLRPGRVLQDTTRRPFLWRPRRRRPFRPAGLPLVLVSALPVFPVAHGTLGYQDCGIKGLQDCRIAELQEGKGEGP